MPSSVAFKDHGRLIGEITVNQGDMHPSNTIFSVNHLIWHRFDDVTVQSDIKRWPFKFINSKKALKIEAQYCGATKYHTAEKISSMVLSMMKETAEAYLDKKVTDAVIAVPAYFNGNQRRATVEAGKLAGSNVLRLINELTAAAIVYSMGKRLDKRRNVLIFD
ncbi:unnamed protein product [Taenia asiatica]|uniref:Heat shock protein 70 family n=1 Tax=Taenia asiatica TaxID=60517 RepID=A0A0R3VSW0_TAEAS|nr:unnamed protein product [Taenia asiatica]